LFAGLGEYISGSILFEETLYDKAATGEPFVELMKKQGIIPGIKTDKVFHKVLIGVQLLWARSRCAPPLTWNRCCPSAAVVRDSPHHQVLTLFPLSGRVWCR
jgi:Fructose-bisphosphate aldolase class-I